VQKTAARISSLKLEKSGQVGGSVIAVRVLVMIFCEIRQQISVVKTNTAPPQ